MNFAFVELHPDFNVVSEKEICLQRVAEKRDWGKDRKGGRRDGGRQSGREMEGGRETVREGERERG